MPLITEDAEAIRQAVAYVIELYRELTGENGAPSLGTQNQAVDFILADPDLRSAAADWARIAENTEATIDPPRRLPCDAAYRRVRDYLRSAMEQPVFSRAGREKTDGH